MKPRYQLCWWCNGRFWGRKHAELDTPNGLVCVHKSCARDMKRLGDGWDIEN